MAESTPRTPFAETEVVLAVLEDRTADAFRMLLDFTPRERRDMLSLARKVEVLTREAQNGMKDPR